MRWRSDRYTLTSTPICNKQKSCFDTKYLHKRCIEASENGLIWAQNEAMVVMKGQQKLGHSKHLSMNCISSLVRISAYILQFCKLADLERQEANMIIRFIHQSMLSFSWQTDGRWTFATTLLSQSSYLVPMPNENLCTSLGRPVSPSTSHLLWFLSWQNQEKKKKCMKQFPIWLVQTQPRARSGSNSRGNERLFMYRQIE